MHTLEHKNISEDTHIYAHAQGNIHVCTHMNKGDINVNTRMTQKYKRSQTYTKI